MTDYIFVIPTPVAGPMEVLCHLIERSEATPYLGQKVVELTNVALKRQFEPKLGHQGFFKNPKFKIKFPEGTIDAAYDAEDEELCVSRGKEIRQNLPIRHCREAGRAACATVMLGHDMVSMARLTRRPQFETVGKKVSRSGYDIQIHEVFTASPRRGLGSAVVYAALENLRSTPGDRIIFDSLKGNGSNRWFRQLGFQSRYQEEVEDIKMGELQLPRERLVIDEDNSKETLISRLIITKPWLAEAQLF